MSTVTLQVCRPPVVSRRLGYTAGATVNLSLATGILVNIARVPFDPRWYVSLGDILSTVTGMAALVRIWHIFPFQFGAGPANWTLVTRVVPAFAFAGSIIGIVVQIVRVSRAARALTRWLPSRAYLPRRVRRVMVVWGTGRRSARRRTEIAP